MALSAWFWVLAETWPWQRQIAKLDVQHVAIKHSDGSAARRQGADRIAFGLGEVIEELPHFADAHFPWVALAVESDEAFTRIGHSQHRRLGVPLIACGVADLVKQASRRHHSRLWLEKCDGAHGCPHARLYRRSDENKCALFVIERP